MGRLEKAAEAARAAGDVGQAARLDRAASALKGGRAAAAARDAQEAASKKLSAGGQATLAKAQAAVAKQRERKLQAQRMVPPGQMQARWRSQTPGPHTGQGQPALAQASEAPDGNSTRAIGRPEGKSGMMRRIDLVY